VGDHGCALPWLPQKSQLMVLEICACAPLRWSSSVVVTVRSCFGILNTVFFCLSVIAASTWRCRFCTSAFISLHLPSPLSRFKPPGVLANGTASTVFLIRPMAPEHQLPRGLMATFAVSSSELCRRWWLRSSHHWTRSFKPPSKLMMLLPALLRKIFYLFKSSYYSPALGREPALFGFSY